MKKGKKKWTKPQLILLYRGTPEENVLNACRYSLIGGASRTGNYCAQISGCQGVCSVYSRS